jgi:hypothetical protein
MKWLTKKRRIIMKQKWGVEKKEFDGKTYFFIKIGSRWFGEPDFLVWVSPKLVNQDQDGFFIGFPVENVDLVEGKRDLILLPGDKNVFNVTVPCGDYSDSKFEIITPGIMFEYQVWSSKGNSSRGALVLTESAYVKFRWKRTGETYGSPSEGVSIIYIDGGKMDLEGNEEDALASLEE